MRLTNSPSKVLRAALVSATMLTTEAMPMLMPSIDKNVRRRLPCSDSHAVASASRHCTCSRVSQPPRRTDGVSAVAVAALVGLRGVWSVGVPLSATTLPSRSSITRRAWLATWASWVTKMMVWPAAFSSLSRRSISAPLALSSAPVGSSAKMIWPPFISARAMDTRCCWPPLSSLGLWCRRSPRPRRSSRACARSPRAPLPTPA
jgi:hypothetical protein